MICHTNMHLRIELWGDIMNLEIDSKAIEIVQAILQRGNDAVIRRKKDGFIILEESKKITYDASLIGGKQGQ